MSKQLKIVKQRKFTEVSAAFSLRRPFSFHFVYLLVLLNCFAFKGQNLFGSKVMMFHRLKV